MSRLIRSNRRTFLMGVAGAAGVLALDNGARAAPPAPRNGGDPHARTRAFAEYSDAPTAAGDELAGLTARYEAARRTKSRFQIVPGRYTISNTFVLGKGQSDNDGMVVEGASQQASIIQTNRAGVDAVVSLNDGPASFSGFRISDLGLRADRFDGARYGLLFPSSEVSAVETRDLYIENVETAIALRPGSGSNGEFCRYNGIRTWNVGNFFESTAGQAYDLQFSQGFAYIRPGGRFFRFAGPVEGGGMTVNGTSGTVMIGGSLPDAEQQGSRATLLHIENDMFSPYTLTGGRWEHLECILYHKTGGRNGLSPNVTFIGVDMTVNFFKDRVSKLYPALIYFDGDGVHATNLEFINCNIEGNGGDFTVAAKHWADIRVAFRSCRFHDFRSKPMISAAVLGREGMTRPIWENCSWNGSPYNG